MKQKMASRRQRKREKVAVGPRPREYKARYKTKSCGEFRVRWRGLFILEEGRENTGVSVAMN